GASAAVQLGSFTDPGADQPWTVAVNWGDGTIPADTFQAATPGTLGTRSHTYAAAGLYAVSVTVTDKDGASGSRTFQVLVGLQVINTRDSGFGSLRQALLDANQLAGTDTITF